MSEKTENESAGAVPEDPGNQTRLDFSSAPPEPPSPSENTGVRLEVDEDEIGWVVFDLPGEKVNKLTLPLMDTLRTLLDAAARRKVKGLAFVSDKPDMFMAGVDVKAIAGVKDPGEGADKAKLGQALFEAIARFPKPTVTVVAGPCVGGGYELALACRRIVAENKGSVRIGLPEVKLGILPGFGGTQRLPRRVGLRGAMDVILSGKTLPARPAFRRGMVDALVPEGKGREIAREYLLGGRRIPVRPRSRIDRVVEAVPFLRNFVLKRAGQMLSRRVLPGQYPAPFKALESIGASFSRSEVAAYGNEARLLGELVVTETSRNLTWLFVESGRAKEPEGLDLGSASAVDRMAVVGAGIMGGGIAWLAGEKGIPIRIKDIAPQALEGAMETAGRIWARNVKRRRLTRLERDRRIEKLSFTLDFTGFRTVDLVVEAVVENLEIKHKVFAELENAVSDDTVLASNTSSLRIEDIAAGALHPERIVGLHFFNPVDRMPLVEVVAGPRSDPRAVATAYRLALTLGKTPILVQDGPGFLVNRLLAFYLGEAIHLFETGADPVRVDDLATRFGLPMGPFALLDQIGLDVADKVTHVMGEAFGERLPTQATVSRLVADGHLGKKSGRGFYLYLKGKKRVPAPEAAKVAGNPARREFSDEDLLDRLLLPMVNEAARCLEEGVVRRPLDVDLGMVMGTGFPPFRGGLLRYADQRGVPVTVERLEALASSYGKRLQPSESLRRRAAGFYSS